MMSFSEVSSSFSRFVSNAWRMLKSVFYFKSADKYTEVSQTNVQWVNSNGEITDEGLKLSMTHIDPQQGVDSREPVVLETTESPFTIT